MKALDRLMRMADALSAARGSRRKQEFPDVSSGYQGFEWPQSIAALQFPQAAKLVPTVKAVTDRIAHEVASLMPTFYRKVRRGRPVKIEREKGNIVDVIEGGNAEQSGYEVLRDLQLSEDINGNGYLFLERFGTGRVQEVWSLPGHLVIPVAGPRRSIARYIWGSAQQSEIAPENVMPVRYTNPNFDPLEPAPVGISPLEAARRAFMSRHNMGRWQEMFYERGGNMNLVLSLKDGAAVTDQMVEKWQATMDKRFGGVAKAFLPVFLRGVDVARAGMTLSEMEFLESAALSDADICRVYGTVPEVFGFSVVGSAAIDQKVAALRHVTGCIEPRVTLRDAVMNERFCPLFGSDIFCKTDLTRLLAVQEARLEMAKSVVILTGQPVLTPNRGLEIIGEPPSDDPRADEIHWRAAGPLGIGPEGPGAPGEDATKPKVPNAQPERSPERDRPAQPAAASRLSAYQGEPIDARKKRAAADLRRYERKVERFAAELFAGWRARARAALERAAETGEIPAAKRVRASLDPAEFEIGWDEAEQARLEALYRSLIVERGEAAAAEVGMEVTLDAQAARIGRWCEEKALRALTGVRDTTIAELRAELAEGVRAQETFAELVARLDGYFDAAEGYRPALIARTETTAAYNFGAREGLTEAGITRKRWLTIGDEAVRDSHQACEAEGAIPMEQPFSNGLQYPGDPAGDVAELANCRCVLEGDLEVADSLDGFFRSAAPGANRLAALFANGVAH